MTIPKPRTGPDGQPEIVIDLGDSPATLAAHAVVDIIRGWSSDTRETIAEAFDESANDTGYAPQLRALDSALVVLISEVQAEEVRTVNRAMDSVAFDQ